MYPTLISPEWLFAHYNSTDIRIFDTTLHETSTLHESKHIFSKKHISNSFQLVLREENATFDQVPKPPIFTKLATSQGLTRGVHAVVYDSDGRSALRAWWLLQYFSHPKVSILLGGLEGWEARGLPMELKKLVKFVPGPETAFCGCEREGVVMGNLQVERFLSKKERGQEEEVGTTVETGQFIDSIQQFELATDQKSVLARLDVGNLESRSTEIRQLVCSSSTPSPNTLIACVGYKQFLDNNGWFLTDILKIKQIFRQNGVNTELPITVCGDSFVDNLHVVLAAFLCSGKGIDGISIYFGGFEIYKEGVQKVFEDAGIVEKIKVEKESDDEDE